MYVPPKVVGDAEDHAQHDAIVAQFIKSRSCLHAAHDKIDSSGII